MSNTRKDLLTEKDDRSRTKGVPHKEREFIPEICHVCDGFGHDFEGNLCPVCSGEGIIIE